MEPNLLPTLFQNLTQAIQISAEAQQNAARERATQRAQSQETMQFMQHHLEQQFNFVDLSPDAGLATLASAEIL